MVYAEVDPGGVLTPFFFGSTGLVGPDPGVVLVTSPYARRDLDPSLMSGPVFFSCTSLGGSGAPFSRAPGKPHGGRQLQGPRAESLQPAGVSCLGPGAETCRSRCPPVVISRPGMCWLPSLVLSGDSRALLVLNHLLLPLRRSWRGEGSEDGFNVAGHGAPQPWCGCAGPSAVEKGGSLIRVCLIRWEMSQLVMMPCVV
ncbi:hypothetical protein J6590_096091 [Homalodisca vitripennis]|nr:hypothetical protein J6590_096091 [Homalodisca vitripennis]